MKNNYLKLASVVLGASLVLTSCVKTEELDSVKALREAKVNQMNASTALINADVKIKNFQASYDSVSHVYQLATEKAQSEYAVASATNNIALAKENLATSIAQAKYNLAVAQSDIANQVEAAKSSLLNYRSNLLDAQVAFARDSTLRANENPAKVGLIADYNAYYVGGNLADGSNIAKGIFTLKSEIATFQATIYTETQNAAANVSTNTATINTKKEAKRLDEVVSATNAKTLALYIAAQNTRDFSGTYKTLATLVDSASADVTVKKQATNALKNDADAALIVSTAASKAYSDNATKKNTAKGLMDGVLSDYSVNHISEVGTILDQANSDLKSANTASTTANTEYTSWATKYAAVNATLISKTNAKNSAEVTMKAAQTASDVANTAPITATPAQLTAIAATLATANAAYATALNEYNTANGEYLTVLGSYTNAQAAVEPAKTAATNAAKNVATITADIAIYDANLPIYTAALNLEASLLLTKTSKADLYTVANLAYADALSAQGVAASTLTTLTADRDALKAIMDGLVAADTAIQALISTATNAKSNADARIAQYTKDITFLTAEGTSSRTAQQKIDEANAKIVINTGLVTLYDAKVKALLAVINAL